MKNNINISNKNHYFNLVNVLTIFYIHFVTHLIIKSVSFHGKLKIVCVTPNFLTVVLYIHKEMNDLARRWCSAVQGHLAFILSFFSFLRWRRGQCWLPVLDRLSRKDPGSGEGFGPGSSCQTHVDLISQLPCIDRHTICTFNMWTHVRSRCLGVEINNNRKGV